MTGRKGEARGLSCTALEGRRVAVTGATGGIGRALARRLREQGAEVIAVARSRERLAELSQELGGVHTLAVDFADPVRAREAARELAQGLSPIYGLVNNAGAYDRTPLEELGPERLEHVLRVNFLSAVAFTREIYRVMALRREGRIVNVSSVAARRAFAGGIAYAASKAALEAFTRCLALEAIERGVVVNGVAPGYVATSMADEALALKARNTGEPRSRLEERRIVNIPARRLASPDEIAGVILFLLSEESRYLVGQTLGVDGGVDMR